MAHRVRHRYVSYTAATAAAMYLYTAERQLTSQRNTSPHGVDVYGGNGEREGVRVDASRQRNGKRQEARGMKDGSGCEH